MKVLIACECSGAVTMAFRARGHNAWSCDLKPSLSGHRFHRIGDVLPILHEGWDLMVAHPPCDFLCSSGARWLYDPRYPNRRRDQDAGAAFFMALANAPIERVAIENPVGVMSTRYRKPDQIIQPWMFGEVETKATCLWLKNLPLLVPKAYVLKPSAGTNPNRIHSIWHSKTSHTERSITLPGVAFAMADQWG